MCFCKMRESTTFRNQPSDLVSLPGEMHAQLGQILDKGYKENKKTQMPF